MITVENREEIITLGALFEIVENVKNGDYSDVVSILEDTLDGERGKDNIITFLNSLDTQEKNMLLEAILYDLAN